MLNQWFKFPFCFKREKTQKENNLIRKRNLTALIYHASIRNSRNRQTVNQAIANTSKNLSLTLISF
jgi:hypothetical protein